MRKMVDGKEGMVMLKQERKRQVVEPQPMSGNHVGKSEKTKKLGGRSRDIDERGKDSILIRFVVNVDDLGRFSGSTREPVWAVGYFVKRSWLGEVAS